MPNPPLTSFPVTPRDHFDLAQTADGLYCAVSGDVALVTAGGDTVTLTGLKAGVYHRIAVSRVLATGTTAAGIMAAASDLPTRRPVGVAIPADGLVALWDMTTANGQSLANGPSGAGGAPQLGSTAGVDANDPAITAQGLDFDGVNDYAACSVALAAGERTFIVVAKCDVLPVDYRMLLGTSVPTGYLGFQPVGGKVRLVSSDSYTAGSAFLHNSDMNLGQFYCLSSVRGAARHDSYTGVAKQTVAVIGQPVALNVTSIGAYSPPGYYLDGTISFVAIYNRALSDAEIAQAYAALQAYLGPKGIAF